MSAPVLPIVYSSDGDVPIAVTYDIAVGEHFFLDVRDFVQEQLSREVRLTFTAEKEAYTGEAVVATGGFCVERG